MDDITRHEKTDLVIRLLAAILQRMLCLSPAFPVMDDGHRALIDKARAATE